jgi:hypothetical protein
MVQLVLSLKKKEGREERRKEGKKEQRKERKEGKF